MSSRAENELFDICWDTQYCTVFDWICWAFICASPLATTRTLTFCVFRHSWNHWSSSSNTSSTSSSQTRGLKKDSRWIELPVASFSEEVYSRIAKRPLVFNGRLANRRLTSLVKETTGVLRSWSTELMHIKIDGQLIDACWRTHVCASDLC